MSCPNPFSCGIRWNELLCLALSSLPGIRNQFKAGRRSIAFPEKGALRTGVALRPLGEAGKAGRAVTNPGGKESPATPTSCGSVTQRMQESTNSWHLHRKRPMEKQGCIHHCTQSQLSSVTSAPPMPQSNKCTNCNRIYQIIYSIITLLNYAAILLIFAYLIMYAYLTYLYLYANSIPVYLIWK